MHSRTKTVIIKDYFLHTERDTMKKACLNCKLTLIEQFEWDRLITSRIENKDLNYILSHKASQQVNGKQLVKVEILSCINLFQPIVVPYRNSKIYEMRNISKQDVTKDTLEHFLIIKRNIIKTLERYLSLVYPLETNLPYSTKFMN